MKGEGKEMRGEARSLGSAGDKARDGTPPSHPLSADNHIFLSEEEEKKAFVKDNLSFRVT